MQEGQVTEQLKQKPEKLLLPEEVAEMLSISRVTIMRWAKNGRIPALKLGKCYRFSRVAIEKWVAQSISHTGRG